MPANDGVRTWAVAQRLCATDLIISGGSCCQERTLLPFDWDTPLSVDGIVLIVVDVVLVVLVVVVDVDLTDVCAQRRRRHSGGR